MTKLGLMAASFSPSVTISCQSVKCGLTSTEMGLSVPSKMLAISRIDVMNGLPEVCTCRGLVVTPSIVVHLQRVR